MLVGGGGGVSRLPSKIFFPTELKVSFGESFTVALISGMEKLWVRGGGVSRFSVEPFCLTVPKNSVGESFTVALIWAIKKVWIRGEGVSRFQVENFSSHSAGKVRL